MKKTMYGVVKTKPVSGAEIVENLPIPEIGERDILVKIQVAAICGTDLHILAWSEYAQTRVPIPMVFGHEFSGDVVAVGEKVTEVEVGDRVAGETHIPCNHCIQCETGNRHICENMKIIGVHVPGVFAEYISFPADCAYKISADMDYKVGAMMESMGVAVHGASVAEVKGKIVAIYGCGPIGLMAVGAVKAWGAKNVIAIDVISRKLDIAKEMGADVIIDCSLTDSVAAILKETTYGADVVIDYTGNLKAIKAGFSMVKKGGRFVMVGLANGRLEIDPSEQIIYKELTVIGVTGRLMYETWDQCVALLQSGKFNIDPVISGEYPMREYEKAFAAIISGSPGKMMLIP